jgi:hypothetical protein
VDAWLENALNLGRWVSTKDLFNQFHGRWAVTYVGTFPWRDTRQLGQQITSLRSTLEMHYAYEEKIGRAGVRYMRFNMRRGEDDVAEEVA